MDLDRLKTAAGSAVSAQDQYLLREIEASKRRIAQLQSMAGKPEYLSIPTTFISDPVPVIMLDSDFKLLEANQSFALMSGYSAEELAFGSDVRFFFPKSAHKHLEKARQNVVSSSRIDPWETEVLTKDGRKHPVIVGLTKNGPSEHDWVIFFFDMSARKKLQKELAIRESNLHTLAEAIPQLLWVCDADGKITYANGGFLEFTGLTLDQPLNWTSLLHPTDKLDFNVTGFSVGELYADFQCEVRLRGYLPGGTRNGHYAASNMEPDANLLYDEGSYRWHLLKVVPFFGSGTASMSWLVIATDVDDQRRVTEALLASEEQLRIIADAMPQIVWTADSNGTIDFWNHRWFEYTGLTVPQSLHGGWRLLIHPDDLFEYDQKWRQAINTAEPLETRFRLKRALGLSVRKIMPHGKATTAASRRDYLWHLCRAVPVKNSQGEVLRWFGTWTEIDDHSGE